MSFVIVASFAVLVVAPGKDGGNRGASETEDACRPQIALENDRVKLWFQGLRGHVQVFDLSDDTTQQAYTYQTRAVVEILDGVPVASLDLGRAWPQASTCTIDEHADGVDITYTVTAQVRSNAAQPLGQTRATFAFHYDSTENGAKFDLHVDGWPWQSDASLLAYDFSVRSPLTIVAAENGVGFRQGTAPRGYIEWAPNATAHYGDGLNESALVQGETTMGDGNHTADVRLAFTNVTAGYAALQYDPFIGVGEYVIVKGRLVPDGGASWPLPEPLRPAADLRRTI